jgi:hypothetical protein
MSSYFHFCHQLRFSLLYEYRYYFTFLYENSFRHAYPETAYITATPTGTIGPITVSEFNIKKTILKRLIFF